MSTAKHLITTIRQIDGGSRELYAATNRAARQCAAALRRDPAMIDGIGPEVSAIIDVDSDGKRTRVR